MCVCLFGVCLFECVRVGVHACVHTLKADGSGFNSYCGDFMLVHVCVHNQCSGNAGNSNTRM